MAGMKAVSIPLAVILLFSSVVFVVSPAGGDVVRTVISESEPNNDVNSADVVPRSTTGVNVTGEVGGGDVSDFFKIELQGGS
ncbi:MAG: hypothetical protein J7L88_01120, partial [Thermoplasmata archaeon]|nr:hypothetical protein [Thermoplasmata archaeon]